MRLPTDILDIIDKHSTEENATEIKAEILGAADSIPLALQITGPIEHGRTHGDWYLNIDGNELRPDSSLSWPIIDSMEKAALPGFAILMKLAPILSVFRSWQGILVKCPSDEELAEVVGENMRQVLPLMAMDFGFRSMIDGTCFMETRWENTTKYKLGLSKNRLPSKQFTVAKQPHIVDPRTVTEIKRTKGQRKFDGFIQKDPLPPHENIPVGPKQSLVIPHNERFRNLWGTSALEPMYRPWFWTQVMLRSIVRWGERMAVPTAIGTAPMFDTIPDPSDTTKTIKALDYMASVASSLSRSQSATVPSDVDPDTKKPMYTLRYESSGDGGVSSALTAILQELVQMVIRAAISADRSTTQSSGGVGSYNIGSIHDRATQYHNQMVLLFWINYLNKYFLPWLSFYTRGVNGPPIRLEVATIDPAFRDLLIQMLGTMGNTKPGQDALWQIDYPTLLNLAHVPTIDPEEAQKLREKSEKEAMERAEEAMVRQQKLAPPPEAAEGRKEQAAREREKGNALDKKANEAIKKVEAAADTLADLMDSGKQVPIYVGLGQMTELIKEARKPIVLGAETWDEGQVTRDPGGRFATKAGVKQDQPPKIGDKDVAEKHLKTLGLTDLELVDAMKILEGVKSYDSIEDAFDDVVAQLIDGGFADKDDIAMLTGVEFSPNMLPIQRGIFNPVSKNIFINEGYKDALLRGDPLAVQVLRHEILHASAMQTAKSGKEPTNEFQRKALEAGIALPDGVNKARQLNKAVYQAEGRNQLATLISMNEYYGTSGLDNDSRAMKAVRLSLIDVGDKGVLDNVMKKKEESYGEIVEIMAQMSKVAEKRTGIKPKDWIIETNRRGGNYVEAEQELKEFFPDRMRAYGNQGTHYAWPDDEEVSTWIEEDYGINRSSNWVRQVVGDWEPEGDSKGAR